MQNFVYGLLTSFILRDDSWSSAKQQLRNEGIQRGLFYAEPLADLAAAKQKRKDGDLTNADEQLAERRSIASGDVSTSSASSAISVPISVVN